jgi:serine/threonine protein kinase
MVERRTHKLKLIDFGLAKHLESVKTLGVGAWMRQADPAPFPAVGWEIQRLSLLPRPFVLPVSCFQPPPASRLTPAARHPSHRHRHAAPPAQARECRGSPESGAWLCSAAAAPARAALLPLPPHPATSQLSATLHPHPHSPDYMPPELLLGARSGPSAAATAAAAAAAAAPPPGGRRRGTGSAPMDVDAAPGGAPDGGGTGARPPPYDAAAVDAWACGVLLYLLITGVGLGAFGGAGVFGTESCSRGGLPVPPTPPSCRQPLSTPNPPSLHTPPTPTPHPRHTLSRTPAAPACPAQSKTSSAARGARCRRGSRPSSRRASTACCSATPRTARGCRWGMGAGSRGLGAGQQAAAGAASSCSMPRPRPQQCSTPTQGPGPITLPPPSPHPPLSLPPQDLAYDPWMLRKGSAACCRSKALAP